MLKLANSLAIGLSWSQSHLAPSLRSALSSRDIRSSFSTALAYGHRRWVSSIVRTTHSVTLVQCGCLIGDETLQVYNRFTFASDAERNKLKLNVVRQKFADYCQPHRNIVHERYQFWQEYQHVRYVVACLGKVLRFRNPERLDDSRQNRPGVSRSTSARASSSRARSNAGQSSDDTPSSWGDEGTTTCNRW